MSCETLQSQLGGDQACYSHSSAAKENGKRFAFRNPAGKAICKVHVDGCLIKGSATKRCDYFFGVYPDEKYYLVELKGSDVVSAITQIETTYDLLHHQIGATPQQFKGVVVASVVPQSANQKLNNLRARLRRDKQLDVRVSSRQHEEAL